MRQHIIDVYYYSNSNSNTDEPNNAIIYVMNNKAVKDPWFPADGTLDNAMHSQFDDLFGVKTLKGLVSRFKKAPFTFETDPYDINSDVLRIFELQPDDYKYLTKIKQFINS